MSKIATIIRNNDSTFYNANTDVKVSTRPRLLYTTIMAVVISTLFREQTDDFLTSVVSAQAILVGFSFSVMFYILSSPHKRENEASIEAEIRQKKLGQLGTELFYNVSYFNLVSIASVILSLILLAGSGYVGALLPVGAWLSHVGIDEHFIGTANGVLRFGLYVAFYFALVESLYTFVRTVGRVTYYFEKRLDRTA